jgi:metal-responsive CopG/Arc/MetJ family transcriptional regulator
VTDILIRDVPEDLVDLIDRNARRLGISRSEYLRRALARERSSEATPTTDADLERIADRFAGLADDELMRRAWS